MPPIGFSGPAGIMPLRHRRNETFFLACGRRSAVREKKPHERRYAGPIAAEQSEAVVTLDNSLTIRQEVFLTTSERVTELLGDLHERKPHAADRLMPIVYADLRR